MYRILFLALFVLALAVPAAIAQDVVRVDSQHYKVESENKRVRVLRIKYGPHEKSKMHSHPDSVAVFLTDGRMKFTFPGGKTEEREVKAGQTMFTPAVKHLPENLGDSDVELILVELKTPKHRPAPKKPAAANANANINGN